MWYFPSFSFAVAIPYSETQSQRASVQLYLIRDFPSSWKTLTLSFLVLAMTAKSVIWLHSHVVWVALEPVNLQPFGDHFPPPWLKIQYQKKKGKLVFLKAKTPYADIFLRNCPIYNRDITFNLWHWDAFNNKINNITLVQPSAVWMERWINFTNPSFVVQATHSWW